MDNNDDLITEEWLRSVGFRDKRYQGSTRLVLPFENCTSDSQWIEVGPASCSHGYFTLCRWSEDYDDDMPPDHVEVKAKTRSQLLQLLTALGIVPGGE